MNWTTPAQLVLQVNRLWDQGLLLAPLVTGETLFPKRMLLKGPTSSEISDRFDDVRRWIVELRQLANFRLEMREFRHPVLGNNAVPAEIWIDHVADAVAVIGKQDEFSLFQNLAEITRTKQPALLPWLAHHPLQALRLAGVWSRLLDVVEWVRAHPHSGIYLRQIDIPGVHSKLIETHRSVLMALLDCVLPEDAIVSEASGATQFAPRYGFLDKPQRIRFRMLDPAHALLPELASADVTLDADSFARLRPTVSNVFITENEVNFLALPFVREGMAIFGAGYGFEALSSATWLSCCRIHYWGDIDTHGFAILDQLRSKFDHAESFLMDRRTLMAHEFLWGTEPDHVVHDLLRLNESERALFDELRHNRLRQGLRLEQEHVGFAWMTAALAVVSPNAVLRFEANPSTA